MPSDCSPPLGISQPESVKRRISVPPYEAYRAMVLCYAYDWILQVTAAVGGQLVFDLPVRIQVCSAKRSCLCFISAIAVA